MTNTKMKPPRPLWVVFSELFRELADDYAEVWADEPGLGLLFTILILMVGGIFAVPLSTTLIAAPMTTVFVILAIYAAITFLRNWGYRRTMARKEAWKRDGEDRH